MTSSRRISRSSRASPMPCCFWSRLSSVAGSRPSAPDSPCKTLQSARASLCSPSTSVDSREEKTRPLSTQRETRSKAMKVRPEPVLATGRRQSVGVRHDTTVIAAGSNKAGECEVGDWVGVVAVAAGNVHMARNTGKSHTVALRADGTVLATGWNDDRQCEVSAWRGIVGVEAGSTHTLGLCADGTVVSAGNTQDGRRDTAHLRSSPSAQPAKARRPRLHGPPVRPSQVSGQAETRTNAHIHRQVCCGASATSRFLNRT